VRDLREMFAKLYTKEHQERREKGKKKREEREQKNADEKRRQKGLVLSEQDKQALRIYSKAAQMEKLLDWRHTRQLAIASKKSWLLEILPGRCISLFDSVSGRKQLVVGPVVYELWAKDKILSGPRKINENEKKLVQSSVVDLEDWRLATSCYVKEGEKREKERKMEEKRGKEVVEEMQRRDKEDKIEMPESDCGMMGMGGAEAEKEIKALNNLYMNGFIMEEEWRDRREALAQRMCHETGKEEVRLKEMPWERKQREEADKAAKARAEKQARAKERKEQTRARGQDEARQERERQAAQAQHVAIQERKFGWDQYAEQAEDVYDAVERKAQQNTRDWW
jgi:hypothetical protein